MDIKNRGKVCKLFQNFILYLHVLYITYITKKINLLYFYKKGSSQTDINI